MAKPDKLKIDKMLKDKKKRIAEIKRKREEILEDKRSHRRTFMGDKGDTVL